jgi:hypothetical protein
MKFIVIILFQIFLLVLELESASFYNLTINENLVICQKQSNKCCRFSGIRHNDDSDCLGDGDGNGGNIGDGGNGGDDSNDGGDGDQDYNNNYLCEETDLFKGTIECACISIASKCSLNKIIECTTIDARGNPFTPTSTNHQAPGTTETTIASTPSKQLSCSNGSATINASITQATALGVIAGLSAVILILAVLLTLIIIGWVCTCLALKKKGSMNINKTNNR